MLTEIRTYSNDEALVQARRLQIIDGATRLLVEKGYDQTNLREIAAACNMSIGALYRYIGSKEDILFLIIDYILSNLTATVQQIYDSCADLKPTEALKKFVSKYYRFVDETQEHHLFNYQEIKNLPPHAVRQLLASAAHDVEACEAILRRGMASGEFRIDNPTLLANDIVFDGHAWALRRWFLRKRCTIDEYISHRIRSVLKSILVDPSLADEVILSRPG